MTEVPRKIIHIDMDAFYAAVEQRDHPQYRNKPVIVGGQPDSRGVVATCSYEARVFGVHSAMPSSQAYRLCPQAIFVRPRFDVYRAVSAAIRAIFARYCDCIEPLSLDEAYLDVSSAESAMRLAGQIKQAIRRETGLIASAGVSYNKFLAKIASDLGKPDGLHLITPEQGPAFVETLAVGKFHGIGPATERKMQALGILTGLDLKKPRWPCCSIISARPPSITTTSPEASITGRCGQTDSANRSASKPPSNGTSPTRRLSRVCYRLYSAKPCYG